MKNYSLYLALWLVFAACKKSDFLNANPDERNIIPTTLKDYRAILDNIKVMNGSGIDGVVPVIGEASTDDYYAWEKVLQTFPVAYGNLYKWSDDIFHFYSSALFLDWAYPYRVAFYANTVLDGLNNYTGQVAEQPVIDELKGSALFFRSFYFYELAQVFAPPYNAATASTDLGIPLRLNADVSEDIYRSTVQDSYNRMLEDLLMAKQLLPAQALYKTRPTKAAAFALLARIYLVMSDFSNARRYADSCLSLHSGLMDFNTLPVAAANPISKFNEEVMFHSCMIFISSMNSLVARVDTNLYKLYADDDLRKTVFFSDASLYGDTGHFYRGSYDGSEVFFAGLATDETYLIKAEAEARLGHIDEALESLNMLLSNRMRTGTFIPVTASTSAEALEIILTERRKELCFRGIRWTDLRRLNVEGASISLNRTYQGQSYQLPPNSPRYTFLIPPSVVALHPDMIQNLR